MHDLKKENKVELYSKSGKVFYMQGDEGLSNENIRISAAGYIITKDGKFVVVPEKVDHSQILTDYIVNYLDMNLSSDQPLPSFESSDGAKMLNQEEHIVYFGIRQTDFAFADAVENRGCILLPQLEKITQEQKEALGLLMSTNRSVFGTGNLFDIDFGSLSDNMSESIQVQDNTYNYRDIMDNYVDYSKVPNHRRR